MAGAKATTRADVRECLRQVSWYRRSRRQVDAPYWFEPRDNPHCSPTCAARASYEVGCPSGTRVPAGALEFPLQIPSVCQGNSTLRHVAGLMREWQQTTLEQLNPCGLAAADDSRAKLDLELDCGPSGSSVKAHAPEAQARGRVTIGQGRAESPDCDAAIGVTVGALLKRAMAAAGGGGGLRRLPGAAALTAAEPVLAQAAVAAAIAAGGGGLFALGCFVLAGTDVGAGKEGYTAPSDQWAVGWRPPPAGPRSLSDARRAFGGAEALQTLAPRQETWPLSVADVP